MQQNNHDYIISGGQQGKSRLDVLSHVLQDYTKSLLEKHGVSKGISFLDVGCGGGNVSAMVADMVGENGLVTAIDFDESIIALAKQDAEAIGRKNVTFNAMSAYELPYNKEFDVAYARFLLSHLEDPLAVLQRMKQGVKPGGRVIVEDVQFSGHFCHPYCNAFCRYVEYYMKVAEHKGANAEIGPMLVSLFREAGFNEIGFDMIQPCFNTGEGKWMAWLTLDRIKETLINEQIAFRDEIVALLHEIEDFTNDQNTVISMPRIFRVWGVNTNVVK
ncbi:MAG: ubiE 5 [Flavipsychrobacter sp.]|jgi:ubiquinone/menaquinone biosynthesis C-methylase UbiE|nr:ubiE 5 [Flavipsychrobacter sp.]